MQLEKQHSENVFYNCNKNSKNGNIIDVSMWAAFMIMHFLYVLFSKYKCNFYLYKYNCYHNF